MICYYQLIIVIISEADEAALGVMIVALNIKCLSLHISFVLLIQPFRQIKTKLHSAGIELHSGIPCNVT